MEKIKEEHWVPAKYIRTNGTVVNFTGLYEVSDLGRVRRLNYHGTGKAKVLSLSVFECSDGTIYYQVRLHMNKRYQLSVHRLVLSSFKESEFFEGAVADHIDARTSTSCNDRLCNLRWITQQQNVSTKHCRSLQSKAQKNNPKTSKRVKVTNLSTNETTIYPSAMETGRSLGINPNQPAMCINRYNGFYKKRGLRFEYID